MNDECCHEIATGKISKITVWNSDNRSTQMAEMYTSPKGAKAYFSKSLVLRYVAKGLIKDVFLYIYCKKHLSVNFEDYWLPNTFESC